MSQPDDVASGVTHDPANIMPILNENSTDKSTSSSAAAAAAGAHTKQEQIAPVYDQPAPSFDEKNHAAFEREEEDAPTEEEIKTLRHVSDKIPWNAFTIAFVELCERFSYYGTTVVCM